MQQELWRERPAPRVALACDKNADRGGRRRRDDTPRRDVRGAVRREMRKSAGDVADERWVFERQVDVRPATAPQPAVIGVEDIAGDERLQRGGKDAGREREAGRDAEERDSRADRRDGGGAIQEISWGALRIGTWMFSTTVPSGRVSC